VLVVLAEAVPVLLAWVLAEPVVTALAGAEVLDAGADVGVGAGLAGAAVSPPPTLLPAALPRSLLAALSL